MATDGTRTVESLKPPDDQPPPTRKRSWVRWLLAAVLISAVVGFYAFGLNRWFSWETIRTYVDTWKVLVEQNLLPAVLIFFLIYVTVTALSLPAATLLTLLAGALFGRWVGTAVVSVAATLGATLAFLSSRYLLRDWVQSRFGPRLEAVNRGVERDGAFYLFSLRLVPVVPFWLINLGMGLTPMRVGTFAAVSWLGMLLGTFLFVNLGTELKQLDSPQGLLSWPMLASLALVGVVPLLLRWLFRRLGRLR